MLFSFYYMWLVSHTVYIQTFLSFTALCSHRRSDYIINLFIRLSPASVGLPTYIIVVARYVYYKYNIFAQDCPLKLPIWLGFSLNSRDFQLLLLINAAFTFTGASKGVCPLYKQRQVLLSRIPS